MSKLLAKDLLLSSSDSEVEVKSREKAAKNQPSSKSSEELNKKDKKNKISQLVAKDPLLSSSESEAEMKSREKAPKRKSSSKTSEESAKKHKKATSILPVTMPSRVTASILFGEDSSEEDIAGTSSSMKSGKTIPPLVCYYTKRAKKKGYARQINDTKEGKFFVELKIYEVDEIKKIQPVHRWRHAITTIKTKLNEDTESWRYIKKFVQTAQKDFKNSPISVLGAYE